MSRPSAAAEGFAPRGVGVAAALLLVACAGAPGQVASASGSDEPCARARELRNQAAELHAGGKVDRAHRTLDAANLACPGDRAASFGLELETLVDLGLEPEASALAREIAGSREASAADTARAKAWLAAPREGQPASGEQLLAAGLAKKAQGALADAQKLFDRARVALEARAGSAVVFEPTRGLWDVSAMSWTPDGNTLVLAVDGVLHWFGTDGYREIARQNTGNTFIASVAFSPDGRSIALGVGEGGAVLWDVEAARQVGALTSEVPGALRTLVFSPDGTLLAGRAWEDSRVPVWSVASRQALPSLLPVLGDVSLCGLRGGSNGPGFWPEMLAFNPDGKRLLGTCAQSLGVWAVGSREPGLARALKGAEGDEFYSVASSPDGRYAVAGTESGAIVSWDVGAGRRIGTLEAHELGPLMRFSRDGKQVTSAGLDGSVRSFSLASGSLTAQSTQRAPVAHVDALAIHPDATKVALAGGGGVLVQAVTGEVSEVLGAPLGISALAVDRAVTRLALGTDAGAVGLLDIAGGTIRWSKGHGDAVNALAFSPDGATLASVARDKTARLWDVKSGQPGLVIPHAAPLNGVAYRPDGQALVTAGDDGVVHVWDPKTGKALRQLEASRCPIAALSYSPDGTQLVASATDHALLRWSAQTYAKAEPPVAATPQPEYACAGELRASATSVAFAADGALIASAPAGHDVELWSARTGERKGSLTAGGSDFHAVSVALSPRDPLAVAAGAGAVRAWRLPEQSELTLPAPPSGVDSLVFSSDGRFLFGATQRGAVAIWRVAPAGTELTLALTLELSGAEHALAATADGLVQWLGPPASAACVLGSRLYAVELCEERFLAPGLVARVLSGG